MDDSLFVDAPHPDTQEDLFVDTPHPGDAAFSANREAIEPGVMGETAPLEQRLVNNATTALTGATLPSGVAGLVKGAIGLGGKAVESLPGLKNSTEYLNRFAQNQMIKNVGGVRGQIKQLGPDKARAIADYMFEKGLAGPMTGSVGIEQNIANQTAKVGGKLGDIRAMAKTPHNVADLTSSVRSKLDPEILVGARSGESGVYQKALDELAKHGESVSPANLSKTITTLSREAKNLNSLKAPSGAMADVGRNLRGINDAAIKAQVPAKIGAEYEGLLGEYSKLKPLEAMENTGTIKEMTSKPGLVHGAVNRLMEGIGHKGLAHAAKGVVNQIRAPWEESFLQGTRGLSQAGAEDQNDELKRYLQGI